MRIADYRKYNLSIKDEPPTTALATIPDVKGVVMGPTGKVLGPSVVEDTIETSAAQADIEIEAYEVDVDDFEVLKDCFEFFNELMKDLLMDHAILSPKRVKEMAGIAAEIHMLINEYEVYKPEEAGDIQMAASLEEESNDLRIQTPAK